MIYLDDASSFDELLRKDGSVIIHQRNLQFLAIEMFKVAKDKAPIFMNDIFATNENILTENVSSNTRSKSSFYNPFNPKTVNYGLETLRSLGPKIWNMIPSDLKGIPTLCKFYVPQMGYIS